LLQEHAEEASKIAQRILEGIFRNKHPHLSQILSNSLENEISGYAIDAEASSYMYVEGEDVQLELLDYDPIGDEKEYEFTVVQSGPSRIAIQMSFNVKVKANATFSFSLHDSTDDDYIGMGSSEAEVEDQIEVAALITFEGDFKKTQNQKIEITSVEIVKGPYSIDFGDVEPDYSNDHYEDEPEYA
jgi:hypothetical protein